MTDRRSPAERVLDLVVFGPAGLAVTVAEEFPKLVEKGRHRVEGQVHTARLVGQMAFQMGRRQMEQTIDRLAERRADHPDHHQADKRADHPDHQEPDIDPEDVAMAAAAAVHPAAAVHRAAGRPPAASGAPSTPGSAPPPPTSEAAGPSRNGSGPPAVLAIPGYDSLSASQVVQRLDGLSPVELEEVRAHEAAHRHRRTILHRVEQLLAGADGAQP